MKRRISWQRAKQLCPLGQCAGVLAAICVVLRLILLGMGYAVQRMGMDSIVGSFGFGICCIAANTLVTAPLEVTTFRWMGEQLHLLNDNDRGFLACSGRFWLWRRWFALRFSAACLLLISCVPSAVACGLAERALRTPADGILTLLISAHLLILSVLLLALPLRLLAVQAALPLYFLKAPHLRCSCIFRMADRATRRRTKHLLLRRAACLPLLVCPFTMLRTLPVLFTAELVEMNANSDKIIYVVSHTR